ncbi:calcium uniporter protein 2, mitochondrial-like [Curcuma longa]|uniref:calcium uniporter protein 2, mitochondrial-like n=1 Tax=Curcuma longa TaxID=136217 RepID=UPI003D9F7A95
MAFRIALARRLLNLSKIVSSFSSSLAPPPTSSSAAAVPKLGLLHQSHARLPFAVTGDLPYRVGDRIRFEYLSLPDEEQMVTVSQARKVLRAAQMEAVREKLKGLGRSCISYAEFGQICGNVPGIETSTGLTKALDESGAVVVFGDVVFLRPEMVAKAIERMIPSPAQDESQTEELRAMEAKKAWIEKAAAASVRREMWTGLGFIALQTAGFLRLTFWELSWDVMEPICFYVTSAYFMLGYAFFLRTSRDPSFEGFFQARFDTKQAGLLKAHGFDVERFHQLRKSRVPAMPDADSHRPFSHCCH